MARGKPPRFDVSHLDGRPLHREDADGRIWVRQPWSMPSAIAEAHGFTTVPRDDEGQLTKELRYSHSRGSTT